jgi:hypothetical protein
MDSGEPLLHVWLIADGGDGSSFLADIRRMLEAIAARDGLTLIPPPALPVPLAPEQHFLASVHAPSAKLLGEAGIHRAQIVPHDSAAGRVSTSAVGVEFVSSGAAPTLGKLEAPILKTYNYIQHLVSRHDTQERLPLEDVLSALV